MARSFGAGRSPALDGPYQAGREDIPALNQVFSDAFTERYRRDGMMGVRVPFLNPAIWRYALDDAGEGRWSGVGERGEIAAFNMTHRSGTKAGWDPWRSDPTCRALASARRSCVPGSSGCGAGRAGHRPRDDAEDDGQHRILLRARSGARAADADGDLDAAPAERAAPLLGRLPQGDRDDVVDGVPRARGRQMPGYDFTREIVLTDHLALGDTVLLYAGSELAALRSATPRRWSRGGRAKSCGCSSWCWRDEANLDAMVRALADYARRCGRAPARAARAERVRQRVRAAHRARRARAVDGSAHDPRCRARAAAERGIVWSNWEV